MALSAMIHYIQDKPKDIRLTPLEAVIPLYLHVLRYTRVFSEGNILWEPASMGLSIIAEMGRCFGLEVVETDIVTGTDFLTSDPPADANIVITNPPYSIKDRFIQRCYEIGKPFALLLPVTALGGKKRVALYREYGVSALILDKRVNFIYPGAKDNSWFNVMWLYYNIDGGGYPTEILRFSSIEEDIVQFRKLYPECYQRLKTYEGYLREVTNAIR